MQIPGSISGMPLISAAARWDDLGNLGLRAEVELIGKGTASATVKSCQPPSVGRTGRGAFRICQSGALCQTSRLQPRPLELVASILMYSVLVFLAGSLCSWLCVHAHSAWNVISGAQGQAWEPSSLQQALMPTHWHGCHSPNTSSDLDHSCSPAPSPRSWFTD